MLAYLPWHNTIVIRHCFHYKWNAGVKVKRGLGCRLLAFYVVPV